MTLSVFFVVQLPAELQKTNWVHIYRASQSRKSVPSLLIFSRAPEVFRICRSWHSGSDSVWGEIICVCTVIMSSLKDNILTKTDHFCEVRYSTIIYYNSMWSDRVDKLHVLLICIMDLSIHIFVFAFFVCKGYPQLNRQMAKWDLS